MSSSKTSKADEMIDLDPDFTKGDSSFWFPNGDTYAGEFCAHRTGIVWRHGMGTYTTQDGQVYEGEWRDDQLVDTSDVDVSFPSGVRYCGKIVKSKYTGPGIYIMENKMTLICEFLANKPSGEICLVDINGREWRGPAEETEAVLLPEHIYFNDISEDRGKGRVRSEPSKKLSKTPSEKTSEQELDSESKKDADYMKRMEMKIFAKCMKTASELRFTDTSWYHNYVNFKKVYEDLMEKHNKDGYNSLTEREKNWYQKYLAFKKRYFEILEWRKHDKKLSEYKLFQLFNSNEYKSSCFPVPVFYPTTAKHSTYKEITFKDTFKDTR